MIHVVDTHAIARYVEDLNLLGAASRSVMTDPDSVMFVPTIAIAEARWMIEKQRAQVLWDDVLATLDGDPRFVVTPLTLDIVRLTQPGLEMHDALICATAVLLRNTLNEEVRLVTRDRRIRNSGLVETVW